MKQLLIDGVLVEPERTFESINPATGVKIDDAPDATVAQAEQAIAAARRAFDETGWSTDLDLRVRCLRQLHQALVNNRDELAALTTAEVGHTAMLVSGAALDDPIAMVAYYADLAERFAFREELVERESYGRLSRRLVEREPAGVVSAIIAYNFPTQLALAKIAPALAAGCTVVLKAAPQTPLITLALGHLIAEQTDIPAGVVNVLSSSEVAVGEVLTTHPDIDMISFTGSTAVGRKIMAAASDTVKKVFLELGGKSAAVVLDDADVDTAAFSGTTMICANAGQGCAASSRFVVDRSIYDQVVDKIGEFMKGMVVGDPADPATFTGPLITEEQRDKVDGFVQRAVADGARLVTGGHRVDGPGYFYAPTLLADVDPDSEIAQEELFGPVLVAIPCDGDDDAVRIANNSRYGLAGGVLSADDDRALAVARRIRTGAVSVNGAMWYGEDAPFGGYKQSGIGREMGEAGLNEFLEIKTIAVPVR